MVEGVEPKGDHFSLGREHECCLCDKKYRWGIDGVRCPHSPPERRSLITAKKFFSSFTAVDDTDVAIGALARLIEDQRAYGADDVRHGEKQIVEVASYQYAIGGWDVEELGALEGTYESHYAAALAVAKYHGLTEGAVICLKSSRGDKYEVTVACGYEPTYDTVFCKHIKVATP